MFKFENCEVSVTVMVAGKAVEPVETEANEYNEFRFNWEGLDAKGYDIHGYNVDGYDADGFDADGYDAEGYNLDYVDRNGDARP